MKELLTLNKYIWRYKWRFLLGIIFVFFSNYFRVWQPQVIRKAVDLVFDQIQNYNQLADAGAKEALYNEISSGLFIYGATILGLALTMGLFMYFMRQTVVVMSRLIEYDLRKDIFGKYEELDVAFFKRNSTGDMMARITEDVSKVRMYLGPGILYGLNLISLFSLVIASMFSVSTKLTLYALIPLPILSISIYFVSNLINKKSTRIQKQIARLNSISQEVYTGIRVIKSYVQEKAFSKHFLKESNDYKVKSLELARVNALFFPLVMLLIGVSNLLVIYIGGIEVSKGNISAGNIAEFIIYVNMLTWPVTSIGWIASLIQQAEASQARINEFMHTKGTVEKLLNPAQPLVGEIIFENVSLTYPDTGIEALNNVSFTIKAGEKVGIIGKTASGKSSVADLLLRLYDPTKGRILLDGIDLKEWNLSALRKQIGYVPQDVFLFSDTIAENIAFGKTEVDQQEVEQHASNAAVHQDIILFNEGYETMIGERGVMLSGGQKQRLSIARALIKNPSLVIMDDSLSAVDSETEHSVMSYLSETLKSKTALIITHRIHSQLNLDRIISMKDGQVVEFGTPKELLNSNGYFNQMMADSENVQIG